MFNQKVFFSIVKICFSFLVILFISSCSQSANDEKLTNNSQKPKDDFTLLNDEIAANPGNADLLYRRSLIFIQKNEMNQALIDINKAVSIDSSKAEYFLTLADICFKSLQIQKSSDAFSKAVTLDPKNIDAHLKLAELNLYIKAYPKSLMEANEALRIDKNTAKAYFIKGFVYKETADTAKALSSFQTAVEVNPDYYDAYIQLGNIQSARKNPIAVQYYNNALVIKPSSTEAYYNRGLFLQNIGELDKAIEDYNSILKIDSRYADAHYNLGYIDLAFKKDYSAAIKHFTDAIRGNSEYAEAYYNRGLCYEYTGDKASAVKDYRKALDIIPTFKLAKQKLKELL